MKKVFLILGESGSGKTSICNELEKRGFTVLQSYTTRQSRYEDETGHTFCSIEEYNHFRETNQIVAYTFFDNSHYFSTKEQLINSDIYVIDPSGIEYLKENVKDIEFITIYIQVREQQRIARMYNRGDNQEMIENRLINDTHKFKKKTFDYAVVNNELDKTVKIIEYIMLVELDEV